MKTKLFVITILALAAVACDEPTSGDEDTDTWPEPFDGGVPEACVNAPGENEICIPGERFPMGCSPYDDECRDVEKPLHVVKLSAFFIDKYEATNDRLVRFLNALGPEYEKSADRVVHTATQKTVWDSNGQGLHIEFVDGEFRYTDWPDEAAGGLSHHGAGLLCESEGKRLPTEAEWEHAARGTTYNVVPCDTWGPNCGFLLDLCADGQCVTTNDDESMTPYEYDEECAPSRIDMSTRGCNSPFGLRDMIGNVAEWVADGFAGDHSWCADGCTDPAPTVGDKPIMKGSGFCGAVTYGRISARGISPNSNNPLICYGVRCARDDAPLTDPSPTLPDAGRENAGANERETGTASDSAK